MKRKVCETRLQILIADIRKGVISINKRKSNILCSRLESIEELIGLNDLKNFVCDLFYFYAADLPCENQFRNISITGKPGCGKTEASIRIGNLLQYLVFNCMKPIRTLTRADLIGQVLGETAMKTSFALNDNNNRCVFIDEVYALGNSNNEKDIYSKECIDTICAFLSENISTSCMIIAGYANATNECFFAQNEGLKRRFPFTFEMSDYTCEELLEIFKLKTRKFVVNGHSDILEHFKELRKRDKDFGAAEVLAFVNQLLLVHSAEVCRNNSQRTNISLQSVMASMRTSEKTEETHLSMYM